tara:strand:+ start:102 stop:428 length:327 start_codon:yes stop_codon:yes gene_type:complete
MFYIYEKSSTYIIGKHGRPDHRKDYKTMPAARAALTRLSKAWWDTEGRHGDVDANDPQFRYAIAEAEYFHKSIEKSRTTSNMMSGKPIVEPVNTPNYMSPSSEAYWSM